MAPHKSYTLCDGIYLTESAANKLTDETVKWEERRPIGVRFNPTDRALASIFVDKFFNRPFNIVLSFIRFIEVYKHEPWNLSKFAHEFGEGKSYFFTSRKKKYGKGKNIERTTPAGFWQKTGDSSIEIMDDFIGKLSVTKTSLTFYKKVYKTDANSGKKEKTRWQMKEYTLEMRSYGTFVKPDDFDPLVLCVVYFHEQKEYRESEPGIDDISNQSSMPNMPFADHDYPGNCHIPFIRSTPEIVGNFSINPLYPSSYPAMMTRQQEAPMFLNSQNSMAMGSQGASFPESVSGTGFDLQILDPDKSVDEFVNNLHNQLPHFMDDQVWLSFSSRVLNYSSMSSPEPLLDSCLQSGNEHESNQLQHPNSHSSSDQIIQQQQQPSDSAMTWNTKQQNPAELTPTNLQLFDHHDDESMLIEAILLELTGNGYMYET